MASTFDLDASVTSSAGVSIIRHIQDERDYPYEYRAIHTEAELRELYKPSAKRCVLRIIHVRNQDWARSFLSDVYNINTDETLASVISAYEPQGGRTRSPMMKAEPIEKRALDGTITYEFACDYLQPYGAGTVQGRHSNVGQSVFELEKYDASGHPVPGYDIYFQRVSVYFQFRTVNWAQSDVDSIPDNGNTIIIFDDAASGQNDCTLIEAGQLQEWAQRLNDFFRTQTVKKSIEIPKGLVLEQIFMAMKSKTNLLLGLFDTHVEILEHGVYSDPEDESRAPDLWKASAAWMTLGRVLHSQCNVARLVHAWLLAQHMKEYRSTTHFSANIRDEMEASRQDWERSLITQRTAALLDLIFKAVGLRDARSSLELGLSMWRLSWISFIFLPLTFSVGVFGMDVDAFASNPSIKWWIITAVVILSLVMLAWYIVKQALIASQSKTYQRGAYESICEGFASKHPTLWTRQGPSENVEFDGRRDALKWRLLNSWFGANTSKPKPADLSDGILNKYKRWLAERWLG